MDVGKPKGIKEVASNAAGNKDFTQRSPGSYKR